MRAGPGRRLANDLGNLSPEPPALQLDPSIIRNIGRNVLTPMLEDPVSLQGDINNELLDSTRDLAPVAPLLVWPHKEVLAKGIRLRDLRSGHFVGNAVGPAMQCRNKPLKHVLP